MADMIHAHEILRMMEGKSFSEYSLKTAIIERFGSDTRFNTCSASDMNADEIIVFLKEKGKFKPTDDGFTMDIKKVCDSY